MQHVTQSLKANTTFDFSKMSNKENNYSSMFVHPHSHDITFRFTSGEEVTLSVAQLAIITAIVVKGFLNPGQAIDYLFDGLQPEVCEEIRKLFNY